MEPQRPPPKTGKRWGRTPKGPEGPFRPLQGKIFTRRRPHQSLNALKCLNQRGRARPEPPTAPPQGQEPKGMPESGVQRGEPPLLSPTGPFSAGMYGAFAPRGVSRNPPKHPTSNISENVPQKHLGSFSGNSSPPARASCEHQIVGTSGVYQDPPPSSRPKQPKRARIGECTKIPPASTN
jgi:hypothetical protein